MNPISDYEEKKDKMKVKGKVVPVRVTQ